VRPRFDFLDEPDFSDERCFEDDARFGNFLRFVCANSSSWLSLIDSAICFDAPRKLDLGRRPRFAESAAPAAICCFFDFAGMVCSSGANHTMRTQN
jgi:hypothetical protein